MDYNILLIGSDEATADELRELLPDEEGQVRRASTLVEATKFFSEPLTSVICDLSLGSDDVFDYMREWNNQAASVQFVLLAEAGDVESAVEGMKLGAVDCLVKPVDARKLQGAIIQSADMHSQSGYAVSVQDSGSHPGNGTTGLAIPEGTSLEDLERAAVQKALEQHGGNRTHAARELGISVRTLQRKLKAWRLPIIAFHNYSGTAQSLSPLSE